ncbi:nuclear transport factor 2 family protein [Vibrio vulnificus]|uniref:nuclear transport factor 2 family protein n=1 Tax=Vibrio vulnificus TaxID=672 RepID=UPI0005F113C8|nr:nuclear transport factor 2 family protein [Vibrio vulnificus]
MNQVEIVRNLCSKFSSGDYEGTRSLFSDKLKVIWPTSREYYESVDEFIAVNEVFGKDWTFEIKHVESTGSDKVISIVYVTSPSWPNNFYATSVFAFSSNQIETMETYWAFEDAQAEWRKDLSKVY